MEDNEGKEKKLKKHVRQRIRLMISIPAIIALFTIAMGIVLYQIANQKVPAITKNQFELQHFTDMLDDMSMVIVIFVSFSIIAGIAIAYTITKPIKRLTKTALSVATGNLSHKVEIDTKDEIGELGNSFNEMIHSLQAFTLERNKFILESFSGGLITTDNQGYILAINSAAGKIFKVNPDRVLKKHIFNLISKSDKNSEFQKTITEAIEKHTTVSNKEMIIVNLRNEIHPIGLSINFIRDGSAVIGIIINFRDLKELKKFHDNMQRTDRLAAVGTFATGIAHEIRNPLGSIKGMAQLLSEDLKNDSRSKKYLDVIIKEVNRLNKVVKELLDFSQPGPSGIMKCDVNMLLAEAIQLVRNDASLSCVKDMNIDEEYNLIPPLVLQPEKVIQAFLNIIQNAVQAAAPNGEVFVRSNFKKDKKRVIVEIENTNSTIPEDMMDKIFDPFFTTKEDGVGLGLSITYQIIVNHKGTIEVDSKDNRTKFIVTLPIQETA